MNTHLHQYQSKPPIYRRNVSVNRSTSLYVKKIEIVDAMHYANELCRYASYFERKQAWDLVQRIASDSNKEKVRFVDIFPLEVYCEHNPSAGECKIYD